MADYFNRAPELTPEEYQNRFVDFYNFSGIQEAQVIDTDDSDDDTDPAPVEANVLMPVGENEPRSVFSAGEGGAFSYRKVEPTEVLQKYNNRAETAKTKTGGDKVKQFQEYLMSDEGVLGGTLGMMGLTSAGPLMAAAGYKNRENQKKTADMILATGGGDMFELNGQLVYRKPKSQFFEGVFQGTQAEMAGVAAMNKKFLPGMVTFDVAVDDVLKDEGHKAASVLDGVASDFFGTVYGADGSTASVGASKNTALRNRELVETMQSMGYSQKEINDAVGKGYGLDLRQGVIAGMAQYKTGPFHSTKRMDADEYNALESAHTSLKQSLVRSLIESSPVKKETTTATATEAAASEDIDFNVERESDYAEGEAFGQSPEKPERSGPASDKAADDPGQRGKQGSGTGFGERYRARGGRVGLQEGGVAGAQAGFVERPPSQVSEAATVADDKPMSVPEGTFVINAAAVEFAGEKDIMKMLNAAYKEAEKKGIQPPSQEMLEVAVSRGEVIVPPFLAKIIGYDRLEKINNRGKKEVNERIKENGQRPVEAAGGGFLTRKKLANGGEIDEYEDKVIADEVRRKMDQLLASVPEDVTIDTKYYDEERPMRREYYQELARLNDAEALTGRFFASSNMENYEKVINVPKTPTLFNLYAMAEEVAHLESKKYRAENPYSRDRYTIPLTDADMRKYYAQYEKGGFAFTEEDIAAMSPKEIEKFEKQFNQPISKIRHSFNAYEAFEKEQDYLEEMRAKKVAFDTVGGLLPKGKRAANMTKSQYEENFINYIIQTASPTIQAGIFNKYPELRDKYFDDKGRFNKKVARPGKDFKDAMMKEEELLKSEKVKQFYKDQSFLDMVQSKDPYYAEGYGVIPPK